VTIVRNDERFENMGLASASIRMNSTSAASKTRIGLRIARDLGWVLVMAISSAILGLAINRVSSKPLPLGYQDPQQRLDAELTALIASPPLKPDPAQTITLAEFRSAVESGSALIIDARSSVFFQQGHVPGALNLARDNFAADYHRLSPKLKGMEDKPTLVYCAGGYCHDSRMVAGALMTLGFSEVRVFTGGWEEWSAAKLPVSTEMTP